MKITLIKAMVISNVDGCNSALARISVFIISQLTSVFNAATRLIFEAEKPGNITLYTRLWLSYIYLLQLLSVKLLKVRNFPAASA